MCSKCDWEKLMELADHMLYNPAWDWAEEFLEGVLNWMEENKHVTPKQAEALKNIYERAVKEDEDVDEEPPDRPPEERWLSLPDCEVGWPLGSPMTKPAAMFCMDHAGVERWMYAEDGVTKLLLTELTEDELLIKFGLDYDPIVKAFKIGAANVLMGLVNRLEGDVIPVALIPMTFLDTPVIYASETFNPEPVQVMEVKFEKDWYADVFLIHTLFQGIHYEIRIGSGLVYALRQHVCPPVPDQIAHIPSVFPVQFGDVLQVAQKDAWKAHWTGGLWDIKDD